MFFACLLDMPYGYYQLVRFVSFVGFSYLAFQSNQQGKQVELFVFGALALLFQPFMKVSLGRELWNVVDVIVGIGLLVSAFRKQTLKLEDSIDK